jgi:cytoskeleton protein RodZ
MTVPEQLRQAREARQLSIAQVAEVTKLRTDHVRALEEGRFDAFSAPVYVRGFVRTYATLLKLDVPQTMAALDEELGEIKRFAPPRAERRGGVLDRVMLQFTKVDWRKSAIGIGLLALLVIAVATYFVWRQYRAHDPLSRVKPSIYQPARTNSGEKLPLPQPPRGK